MTVETFTDAELLEMNSRQLPSLLWKKAFSIYNADPNNYRLSMGCRPCFKKVMAYLLQKRS